jgi:hypothetical protein
LAIEVKGLTAGPVAAVNGVDLTSRNMPARLTPRAQPARTLS